MTCLRKNEMLHAQNSISATLMRDYDLAQASHPGRRCSDCVETMYTGNLVLSSILKLLWERIAHSIANSTFTFQGFRKEMEDPAIRRVAASCSSFHIYAHGSVTALSPVHIIADSPAISFDMSESFMSFSASVSPHFALTSASSYISAHVQSHMPLKQSSCFCIASHAVFASDRDRPSASNRAADSST